MDQNALTVVVPIQEGRSADLKSFLQQIGNNIKSNAFIRFTDLTTTHFARWVVIDHDHRYPPSLAFESNYDGTLDQHLADLVEHGAPGLDKIYSYCKGYPATGTRNMPEFKRFILSHSLDYAAFYIAYRGLTVRNIRNDTAVRRTLEEHLEQMQSGEPISAPAPQLFLSLRETLRNVGQSLSLAIAKGRLSVNWRHLALFAAALGLVAFLVHLMFFLILIFGSAVLIAFTWALVWQIHELTGAQSGSSSQRARKPLDAGQGVLEDVQLQNQLTHIVDIKPGMIYLFTLRTVLWAINLLAKYTFNQGNLGGIPSIHFARWVILDDRRLLFFSNYDGSWENYLGDFIDRASKGLTGVWSNTVGFPRTRFLLWKGAKDEQRFKQWTRQHQIPTQVWYSAHPGLTVQNILNNLQIRGNVERPMNPAKIENWLARL